MQEAEIKASAVHGNETKRRPMQATGDPKPKTQSIGLEVTLKSVPWISSGTNITSAALIFEGDHMCCRRLSKREVINLPNKIEDELYIFKPP